MAGTILGTGDKVMKSQTKQNSKFLPIWRSFPTTRDG